MHILALDLGTKCGFADGIGPSGVWDLRIRRDESGGMRLIRLRGKLREIHKADELELIVFEAARNAGPKMQGALVVLAEMQGVVKSFCEEHNINYRGYSPSEIKRHATGKGVASKEAMLEAAREKWPFRGIADDNEADALFLLDLVQIEIGEPE